MILKHTLVIFVFLWLSSLQSFGEGTKQIRPVAEEYGSLSIDPNYTLFATVGCQPNHRLNIHVSNVGETILFGLHGTAVNNINYNLRKPDGTVVLTGACPNTATQTGYIPDWNAAVIGPYPGSGGYTPLSYQVTNTGDLGDFYIDFSGSEDFTEFDFQVVTGANNPALPGDAINGRVWSGAWQFYAGLSGPYQPFAGKLYIYADDGIVTSCKHNDAHVGRFTIFCNQYGCMNTGNFASDRKSRSNNTSGTFPGIAQYKVFLNNPDIMVYPDGVCGTIIGTPSMIPDPAFALCSGNKLIGVNVNKAGNIEILIDIPYGDATYDVSLYANVIQGINSIPWDGKDGHGGQVPDGTLVSVTVVYVNGLTNLPIWDQERNPQGYVVTLERPVNPSVSDPKTYWDDSSIPFGSSCPTGINLTGCAPATIGCHVWSSSSGMECHDKMINTWWYSASSGTASLEVYHAGTPPPPAALPQYRCAPGTVSISATVLPRETVRWYTQPTGGTHLFEGNPFVTSLPAVGVYTFYAEAYNASSTCASPSRTTVTAEAVATPAAPTPLGAPFYTCGPGTVNMSTTNTNQGIRIDWYDNTTPPALLGSGNSFTTPVINATTIYYTEAVELGSPAACSSATRTRFMAEVRPIPLLTNSQPGPVCSGTTFSTTLLSDVAGATFTWTATCLPPGSVTGYTAGQATPVTAISDLLVNTTVVNALVIYNIIPFANGCSGIPAAYTVTVKPSPKFINPPPPPLCSGNLFTSTLLSDVAGADFTWTANSLPAGSVTGFTASQSTGTVSISEILTNNTTTAAAVIYHVTGHANGCTGPVSNYTVTVNALPIPAISGPPGACVNSSSTYSTAASMTGYTWTVSTGGTITSGTGTNSIIVLWSTIGPKTISVTYTDGNGCMPLVPTVYNVSINIQPIPGSAGPASICVNLSGTYTTDAGMSNYIWAVTPGGTITSGSGTNSINVLWNATGSQSVTINYTDANGCVAIIGTIYTVTVNPRPVPPVSGPGSVCVNTSGSYATSVGMSGYQWSVPAGGTITAGSGTSSITVQWTATGAQSVLVNYTDLNGCVAPAASSYPVTVNPRPVPSASGPASVCINTTGTYSTDAGMSSYLWTVSAGGTITSGSGTNSIQVQWNSSGAQSVSVNYTDANGCVAPTATNYNVTVNPLPVPTIAGLTTVCANTAGVVYTTEAGKSAYTWAVSAGGTITAGGGPTQNTVTVDWITPGPQSISVNYTDAKGCRAVVPVSYPVTVNPLPDVTFNYVTPNSCSGLPLNIQLASAVPGSTFTWTAVTSAPSLTPITTNGVGNSITTPFTNNGFTIETITFTVMPAANNCTAASPFVSNPIPVYPVPDVVTTPASLTICSNTQASIALSSHVANTTFAWTATANPVTVIPASANGTGNISQNFQNTGLIIEPVTFSVIPTANGCPGLSAPYTVNVNPKPNVIFPASPANPQQVCSGTASTSVPLSSSVVIPGVTYAWTAAAFDPVNPTAAISGFTTTGSGNAIPGENIASSLFTQGVIKYTVIPTFTTPGVSCPGIPLEYQTLVYPIPAVALSPADPIGQSICSGQTSQIVTFTTNATPVAYTWIAVENAGVSGAIPGGTNNNIPSQTLTATGPVPGHVRYKVTPVYMGGGSFTCTGGVAYSTIFVNPLPTPVISGISLVCELGPNEIYSTPSIPGHSYLWNVTSGAITSSPALNQITVAWGPFTTSPGTLIVTETIDATGCPKTTTPYSVVLQQRPVPSLTGQASVCVGSTGKVYQTEAGMNSYDWTISGGTITAGGGPANSSATVTWTTPGARWIRVNYVNAIGCPGLSAKQMTVTVNVLPVTTITNGPGPHCEGTPHTYQVPADPLTTFTWSVNPSACGTITSGQGTDGVTVNWLTAGAATIAVTGTNNITSCESSSSHAVTVNSKPMPVFTPCFDLITTSSARKFILRGAAPMLPGQGVFSGNRVSHNPVSGNFEFDPFGAGIGSYPVLYTFTNNFGCANTSGPVNINVVSSTFSCGGDLTDVRDGKKYETGMLGGQCWMTENLAYGNTVDPPTTSQTDNCISERYCLSSDSACSAYGGLYQWDELMKYGSTTASQGICPPGWHIPSEAEWQLMMDNISTGVIPPANGVAGFFLKDPLLNPGFYALMKGLLYINNAWSFTTGSLTATFYWTSTSSGTDRAVARGVNIISPSAAKYSGSRANAFSVRCVKDN